MAKKRMARSWDATSVVSQAWTVAVQSQFLVQRREAKSPSCFLLRVPVSPYFSGHHSLGLLAHSLLSDSETVIKRTHCWRPAVTFLGRIQAKAGCGAFWRDQSVLNYRLEEDNILIRVMRKQIKWPQNMSLETPKLKDMTLLINMSLFSFCFKSLWVWLLYEGRYLDLYFWSWF